ncbi:MAG: hypothetical protein ACJ8GJ_05940 [Vitreoscilla sp.]
MNFKHRTPDAASRPSDIIGATLLWAPLLWALSVGGASAADTPPAPPSGQRPMGPPPEAVAACKGKAAGAQVSFALRDGKTVTGTCASENGVLAARPQGMPPPLGGASAAR